MLKDSFDEIFANKNRIMFVFSHPDDADIFAGGTIARLVEAGKEVFVAKMTLGNKGSRQEKISEQELSEVRLKEDHAAMGVLGIRPENNFYLNFKDGEIESNYNSREQLVRLIRKCKPDIVITHNPEDVIIRFSKGVNWVNHSDHRHTGLLVTDAGYPYSRDILFYPEHFEVDGLESHTVTEFLFVDYYEHPDTVTIDITDQLDRKINAISAHSSQFDKEKSKESADFFTKLDDSGKRYERFRHVVAD